MPARHPRSLPLALTAAAALVVGLVAPITAAAAPPTPGTPDAQSVAGAPQIVPKPVSLTLGHDHFTLTRWSRIVAGSHAARAVAGDLAADLRPATGYPLPVVGGKAHHGDVVLRLGNPGALSADKTGEGYLLDADSSNVTITATTAHGLFDGVQTLRQLLPVWIESRSREPGPWTVPAVHIVDYPRYSYRGFMVDIARHYETPQTVMSLIDQVSAYKVNTLHLHLSDDQGFRIVINGFPRLTSVGAQGSVGTDGRTMDPGGYWTQAQYKQVVAYAAAHFMTVVPEVDSPGHNNAIIMSEYNDTANPRLTGDPSDINCSANHPPQWNYTTAVGYSAMCPTSTNTWAIYTAIISQLQAMSSSQYYDVGGDEVPNTLMSQADYAAFLNTEFGVVSGLGKMVLGWADIAGPGTTPPANSVAEYWNPASGSASGTETGTEAVAKGMKVIMAPANHAYLDQKYVFGDKGNVPPTLGLHWACPTGCDVDQSYNWDPGNYVTGVTDQNVIGVEGAIWGETVRNLSEIDYLVFPRLIALAELGWSPQVTRTADSPAYQDFLARLAAQGARLTLAGTNFYPSTEVPWRLDLAAAPISARHRGVSGDIGSLSAPGIAAGDISVTVNWGDGTSSAATVHGAAATDETVNGLYRIAASHRYAQRGGYAVTITAKAPNVDAATVRTLAVAR